MRYRAIQEYVCLFYSVSLRHLLSAKTFVQIQFVRNTLYVYIGHENNRKNMDFRSVLRRKVNGSSEIKVTNEKFSDISEFDELAIVPQLVVFLGVDGGVQDANCYCPFKRVQTFLGDKPSTCINAIIVVNCGHDKCFRSSNRQLSGEATKSLL